VAVELGLRQPEGQAVNSLAAEFDEAIVSLDRHGATGFQGRRLGGALRGQYARRSAVRNPPYDPDAVTLCALCRRNLLAGERFRYWRNARERDTSRIVCHLCEPSAARGGWLRTERELQRENAVGLRGTVRLVA
jgi:hypothetical protein